MSDIIEQISFSKVFFEVTDDIPPDVTLEQIVYNALKPKDIGLFVALSALFEIDFGDFVISQETTIGELREQARKLGLIA